MCWTFLSLRLFHLIYINEPKQFTFRKAIKFLQLLCVLCDFRSYDTLYHRQFLWYSFIQVFSYVEVIRLKIRSRSDVSELL
jgi:hypothetical protein